MEVVTNDDDQTRRQTLAHTCLHNPTFPSFPSRRTHLPGVPSQIQHPLFNSPWPLARQIRLTSKTQPFATNTREDRKNFKVLQELRRVFLEGGYRVVQTGKRQSNAASVPSRLCAFPFHSSLALPIP